MPTVSEFIRFWRNFSMITLTPQRVVNPGLPVVIGVVLMSLPLMKVCHLVGLRVDLAHHRVADVEGDRARLLAVDAVAGRDAVDVGVDRTSVPGCQ